MECEISKMGSDDAISPETYAEFLQKHEVIIRDEVTMQAFKVAIQANAEVFRDATVLEMGCGSGLLSLWVAQQGAARVYAVEPSDVSQVARQLVRHNRLDHVIQVVQGEVEQLELPQVDIIISKWMGACLMYSSTIEAVLYARERWLKPGGLIFPDRGSLYITLAEEPRPSSNIFSSPQQYWERYLGLNLSHAYRVIQQTPLVTSINDNRLLCQHQKLRHFNMHTLSCDDLSFSVPFKLCSLRRSLGKWFVLYFDFHFPGAGLVSISTDPSSPLTQWEQTLFHIDSHLPLYEGDMLFGEFRVDRSLRHLDFDIDWSFHNTLVSIKRHKQIYRMQGEQRAY